MKKLLILLLIIGILLSLSSCSLTDKVKSTIDQAIPAAATDDLKADDSGKSGIKAPEGSPEWCGYSNVNKIIKKYLGGDASHSYRVTELLGLTTFKDKSFGGARIEDWIFTLQGSYGEYYATIYFNEDGSDVWIRIDPYETVGTEEHYVDGKLAETIDISTGEPVKDTE